MAAGPRRPSKSSASPSWASTLSAAPFVMVVTVVRETPIKFGKFGEFGEFGEFAGSVNPAGLIISIVMGKPTYCRSQALKHST